MEFNNDYLYHCRGCAKHDEDYPDKETDCERCGGTGYEDEFRVKEGIPLTGLGDDCHFCNGDGKYMDWVKIDYHKWSRSDAYGIYTGLYCDDCYDDPDKYTYRKDKYFDPGYAGESLEPEEY